MSGFILWIDYFVPRSISYGYAEDDDEGNMSGQFADYKVGAVSNQEQGDDEISTAQESNCELPVELGSIPSSSRKEQMIARYRDAASYIYGPFFTVGTASGFRKDLNVKGGLSLPVTLGSVRKRWLSADVTSEPTLCIRSYGRVVWNGGTVEETDQSTGVGSPLVGAYVNRRCAVIPRHPGWQIGILVLFGRR